MAGSSFFALLDDIATILDDVSLMTKVAAKKTAGVLGDDLALNAQQVSGVRANRELPVVWAVAKGSLRNKAILVPAALLISAFVPVAITPLLMLGGAYLCFEGFEKLAHAFAHRHDAETRHAERARALADPETDLLAYEREKIKGAVRTDFVLSAEIIVIALGTVAAVSLSQQILVLTGIALLMTVGVYGLVAGIVKLDDLGLYLSRKPLQLAHTLGRGIIGAAPYLMKGLSIVGTAAMFMVGGSILAHGIAPVHHGIGVVTAALGNAMPVAGGLFAGVLSALLNGVFGLLAGAAVLAIVTGTGKLFGKRT